MSAQGDIRKLLRRLRAQGATVERGNDHWKVKDRGGRLVQVFPVHGDREHPRITAAARAALRRAGFRP